MANYTYKGMSGETLALLADVANGETTPDEAKLAHAQAWATTPGLLVDEHLSFCRALKELVLARD